MKLSKFGDSSTNDLTPLVFKTEPVQAVQTNPRARNWVYYTGITALVIFCIAGIAIHHADLDDFVAEINAGGDGTAELRKAAGSVRVENFTSGLVQRFTQEDPFSSAPPADEPTSDKCCSVGAIVGASVGGAALIGLLTFQFFFLGPRFFYIG